MTNYSLTIDEQTFDVEIGSIQGDMAQVTVNQIPYYVKIGSSGQVTPQIMTQAVAPRPAAAPAKVASPQVDLPKAGGRGTVTAPIPGKILTIMVNVGDTVTAGQVLAVIEAMKMENNIISPIAGIVKQIPVAKDDDLGTGDVIMVIE